MDRRNGGDPLAPPRPPKFLPRVHRPRAPEPDTVDSPSIHIISTHPPPIPSHHQPISRMNINSNSSSINSSLSSITTTSSHRSIPPIPPATAPLTPLQSSRSNSTVSTFSRRRTEMPTQRIASTSPAPSVTRSLTPSSVVAPASNFISNAISTVVGRSPSPVNNSVTLQIPRPENERLPNEYVDTPFTNQNSNKLTTPGSRHSLATSTVPSRNQLNSHTTNISTIDGISVLNNNNNLNNNNINNNNNKIILPNRTSVAVRPNLLPITKQPSFRSTSTLCKKDAEQCSHCPEDRILSSQNMTNNNGLNINSANDQFNSITCPQCNRCRCEKCQTPRPLPSKWICNDNCLCSAETIIDSASCLCCVKALFYHCSKDHETDFESPTIRCAENPCSCVPYKRASRWGCLSVLSLLLPCLCCYWPMRGCVSLCASCYAKHRRHGCRCNNLSSSSSTNNSFNSRQNIINLATPTSQDHPPTHNHHRRSNNNDLTPEKRLLDSSNSEY
ncbi:CLUMA_CG004025, isoform A [Clunio marinus]|uniref:CLUMA_CG004025, isoform A n=1 Tax=Clunio marinus TaxID=568069 RepID=A0A1J1HW38_9DIPT|nr:CLUMA_CG004025, isoform A [Clunio marinus]